MKNMISYDVKLPIMSELEVALKTRLMPEMTAQTYSVQGFVPHPRGNGEQLVLPFEGGYSFSLQVDEKIIPLSLVAKKVNERVAAREKDREGQPVSRKEKMGIKEEVYGELLPNALPKSKVIIAYYYPAKEFLMVDTSSDVIGSAVLKNLIHALGTLKSTTIHVSGMKEGLQARLKRYLLEDEGAFGKLTLGGSVKLEGPMKRAVTLKVECLTERRDEILTLLEENYRVIELELAAGSDVLTLTHDFKIKRINLDIQKDCDFEDALEHWQHETGVTVLTMANTLCDLCEMFGYGKDEEAEAA